MKNCSVEGTDSVSGIDYSGGFAGRSSNAVVVGLLSSLGIEVMGNFPVNTVMLGCKINGRANVSSTGDSATKSGYAGGFIGEMRNSYAVDCGIADLGLSMEKIMSAVLLGWQHLVMWQTSMRVRDFLLL